MPRGDGTGPAGMGPMTGRAAGYCAGYNMPGYMNAYGGRMGGGFGWGRGRGWGWGLGYPAAPGGAPYAPYPYAPQYSAEQERQALQGQVKFFEDQIAALKERMGELESEGSSEEKD
ncbi:MAG: DUF5320 domain-containing protein [Spirochaetales bacterium]|nr:DUF5320 domain-containing protein [Spirochaetales bacterium]